MLIVTNHKHIGWPVAGARFTAWLLAIFSLVAANSGFAQQLASEFNHNGKLVKIISTVCPATPGVQFVQPTTSDASVVAITSVIEGMVERNGEICTEQAVTLRMETTGFANVTVGTGTEEKVFEFMPQEAMFAVGIAGVLQPGALPAADFVALTPGNSYDLDVSIVNLTGNPNLFINGFATATLECDDPNPGFAFENGGQRVTLKMANGQAVTKLVVAADAAGQTCKLVVADDGLGRPQPVRTEQLFLGAVRINQTSQPVTSLNVPIAFTGPVQEPLAEMTFSQSDLNSVEVTAFRGDLAQDRPELFVPPLPDSRSVRRYFAIHPEPVGAAFNTTMTLFYDQAEFDRSGLQNEGVLQLYRFNGSKWVLVGGRSDPANNSITVSHVTEFSYWAFAEPPDMPVPVELVTFSAVAHGNEVALEWQTASESANYGFEIQRSSDGIHFEKVGFVPAGGVIAGQQQYRFRDRGLEAGVWYYRLRQLDRDGSFTYSPVQQVQVAVPQRYSLAQSYPNPFIATHAEAVTEIEFTLPEESEVEIAIYNLIGRKVRTLVRGKMAAGYKSTTWDGTDEVGNLAPTGVYLYRLVSAHTVQTKKLLFIR